MDNQEIKVCIDNTLKHIYAIFIPEESGIRIDTLFKLGVKTPSLVFFLCLPFYGRLDRASSDGRA